MFEYKNKYTGEIASLATLAQRYVDGESLAGFCGVEQEDLFTMTVDENVAEYFNDSIVDILIAIINNDYKKIEKYKGQALRVIEDEIDYVLTNDDNSEWEEYERS